MIPKTPLTKHIETPPKKPLNMFVTVLLVLLLGIMP